MGQCIRNMSLGSQPEGDFSTLSPRFLVMSGDGIGYLTPDHLGALRQTAMAMAGGRAVEAMVVTDLALSSAHPEETPAPVPVTRDDFRAFAAEAGYAEQRATRTF